MDVNVVTGESLNILGIALFSLLGYFNGHLFREPGMYKIIAIIVIVPACIQHLIDLNIVYTATIPFVLSALIGFWGTDKTKRNYFIAYDFSRELVSKFK